MFRLNALKILPAEVSADDEYRARFNREADLASTLSVHDRGEYERQLWISMDYVDGRDAARLLTDRYPAGMQSIKSCGSSPPWRAPGRRTQERLAAPRRQTGQHHVGRAFNELIARLDEEDDDSDG